MLTWSLKNKHCAVYYDQTINSNQELIKLEIYTCSAKMMAVWYDGMQSKSKTIKINAVKNDLTLERSLKRMATF